MKTNDDALLRRTSLFKLLPDGIFEKIVPLMQDEHYEFGEIIVKEGDPADSFYVLTSGRARAIKTAQDGQELPLGALKP
jgi:CRP-like cAMP-binding protein